MCCFWALWEVVGVTSRGLVLMLVLGASFAAGASPEASGGEAPAEGDVQGGDADGNTSADASASEQSPGDLVAATEAAREAAQAAREAAKAARTAAEASQRAIETLVQAHRGTDVGQNKEGDEASVATADVSASPWSYQIGISLISVTGNANSVTGKLSGLASGTWDKWRVKFEGGGAYGQTTNETADVTALNGSFRARGERRLGQAFTVYLAGGGGADHVASIELQLYAEPGVSLLWWEEKEADFVRSSLQTDLGFRAMRENRFQYYPVAKNLEDKDVYAPRAALSFRYALSRRAVFTEEAEVLPNVLDPEDLRLTSTSTLTAQILDGVGIALSFKVRHIGAPAEGKVPTDTELSAGVSWTF